MSELIITARDCRAAGICIRDGVRPFCERNNVDFKTFMREGVSESVLLASNEPLALELIQFIRRSHNG